MNNEIQQNENKGINDESEAMDILDWIDCMENSDKSFFDSDEFKQKCSLTSIIKEVKNIQALKEKYEAKCRDNYEKNKIKMSDDIINQLTCSCKEIRADILEDFVIDSLTEHFFNPEVTDIITEQINNKIHEIVNTDSEDIQLAKNSLNGLKVARNNLADAIAKTGFNQTLADKLDSIEKQIVEYEKMIADDDLNKTKTEITKDDVKKKIAELKKCMMNPKNIEQTKIMLQSYIEKIVVDNKSVQVTFMVAFSFCLNQFWYNVHYNHIVEEGRIRLYSDI